MYDRGCVRQPLVKVNNCVVDYNVFIFRLEGHVIEFIVRLKIMPELKLKQVSRKHI